ncbi:hypothetical protein [Nocardioides sp. KR10-350]|uniref:hypothetical protein n=1 Tax=Nocardioides cheoyonin TaxID=3156615 RepID=UPI0032B526E7
MGGSAWARAAALPVVTAVVGLSAAPAFAAADPPVAQASATAASISVAGSGSGTGTYAVTNDGSGQTASGSNEPALTALAGQRALRLGTLAQDATTSVSNGTGTAAACSGLAGNGATVVSVGEGRCLTGGQTLDLSVGSLDFSKVQVVQSDLFQGMDNQLQDLFQGPQSALTQNLASVLKAALDSLGDPGLHLDLGAVQSQCTAKGRTATGTSNIADAVLWTEIPGYGRLDLVALPVDPAPNTHVVTNARSVADKVFAALQTQFTDALQGAADLSLATDQIQPIVDEALDQLSSQLGPLEDNVLDAVLNEQTRGDGSIKVTALDLHVLPAAKQFVGTDAVQLTVGTSSCGPNGRVASRTVPTKNPPAKNPPARAPEHVPTVVTAGYRDASDADGPVTPGRVALFGLVLLGAAGSGLIAYRRTRR